MAAYYGVESGRGRVQVEFVYIVEDIQAGFTRLHHFRILQVPGPFPPVHVSSNRRHRSHGAQSLENPRAAHIAGMDDEIDPLEGF